MTTVLATLHIADLFRDPRMRLPTMHDYQRIPQFLAGTWPRPVPGRFICSTYNEDIERAENWLAKHALDKTPLVIDTEYNRHTKYLTLIGIGARTSGEKDGIPYDTVTGFQVQWPHLQWWFKERFSQALGEAVQQTGVIFQNTLADVPVIEKAMGISYDAYSHIDDTMLAHAVLWSEWPHTLEFLASMYGTYPKMKHLSGTDPLLYNWGDVLDTSAAWEGLRRELTADVSSMRIYVEQSLPLLPVLLDARKRGILVNGERVRTAAIDYAKKMDDAGKLALAWMGWPINLGSSKQLQEYLYGVAKLPVQHHKKSKRATIDADAITALRVHLGPAPDLDGEQRDGLSLGDALYRISEGADPVLESRVIYAGALQADSHYIQPAVKALEKDGRFYPEFLIHAQASGRWSTNNPPLAQLPKDLRDIIRPDPGTVWLGWDWDQIELRLLAALSGDGPLLDAFKSGWDIHTLNACDIFGWPYPTNRRDPHDSPADLGWRAAHQWEGKDDVRRRFAKVFVYRLNYGGDPKRAGDIPGAKTIGLTPSKLVQASQRYLASHPQLSEWRMREASEARRTRESRTFIGRRRRLLGDGAGVVREAYNHPLQGSVADISNLVVVQISRTVPFAHFVYSMHDSQTWQTPIERADEAMKLIQPIVEQPWTINGTPHVFPATFKTRAA